MVKYTIRIDAKYVGDNNDILEDEWLPDSTRNRLVKFLEEGSRYTAYLVYREIAVETKKVHYQGVIEVDTKDAEWHRERWCRLFKDYPKGKKSSAIMKKFNYETYITKDKDKVCVKGYTPEFIKSLEDASYSKEEKTKRDYFDRFKSWIWNYDHKTEYWKYDYYYIAEKLIEFFGVEKQEVKNFQFYRSLVFNVQAHFLNNDDSQKAKETRRSMAGRILDG